MPILDSLIIIHHFYTVSIFSSQSSDDATVIVVEVMTATIEINSTFKISSDLIHPFYANRLQIQIDLSSL